MRAKHFISMDKEFCMNRPITASVPLLVSLLLVFLTAPLSAQQPEPPNPFDLLAMQGVWVRTDAPYVIELRHENGNNLKATYFNRRYINVERTETASRQGDQYIRITLRDENYPGSTYYLRYEREKDLLFGYYILGADGRQFEVLFTRKKPEKS